MSTNNQHQHPHHYNRMDSNLLPVKDLPIFLCSSIVVALCHSSPKVAAKMCWLWWWQRWWETYKGQLKEASELQPVEKHPCLNQSAQSMYPGQIYYHSHSHHHKYCPHSYSCVSLGWWGRRLHQWEGRNRRERTSRAPKLSAAGRWCTQTWEGWIWGGY